MKKLVTKQGVRDLSSLPSKPREKKLSQPPKLEAFCDHVRIRDDAYGDGSSCLDCPAAWDWNGIPITPFKL